MSERKTTTRPTFSRRTAPWLLSLVTGAALAACGTGEDTNGSGGSGAAGATTGSGAGGSGALGGGGHGAGGTGAGGATGGGGAGGGGGGAAPCQTATECDDGVACTTDACNAGVCENVADDAACDDSLFCNGAETCTATGCMPAVSPCVDDAVGCTVTACDEASDACSQVPDDGICDDGVYCNGDELCDPANGDPTTGCLAGTAVQCSDDGFACTVETCDEAQLACVQTLDHSVCPGEQCVAGVGCTAAQPCQNSSECDDNDACNGVETCNIVCQPGTPVICDDGLSCTVDSCDPGNGSCSFTADHTKCDDGLYCDGEELCDPANGDPTTGCTASSGTPCDDGISCTVDSCDEFTDTCGNAPTDALCNDNKLCTGVETCNLSFDCVSSGPPSCDDNIICTTDACDLPSDACVHTNNDGACSNGLFCDGAEQCDPPNGDPTSGCAAGTAPNCADAISCTADTCNETTDSCDHAPDDVACDNGQYCDGTEHCTVGVGCQAGTPVNCGDGRTCTADSCDEALDLCLHAPNDAACGDGLSCNGQEMCDPAGPTPTGCVAGTPIPCGPDPIACTVDACSEATSTCEHTPDGSQCPPGEQCIVAVNGCSSGIPCQNAAECDDGNACNGVESCAGVCQAGVPVDCDDSVGCTVDSCNPGDGTCNHVPNNQLCTDGLACTGVEVCDPQAGCLAGTPVDCDDGIGCTIDLCGEPSGLCFNTPDDALCDDGTFCNGAEFCSVALGSCQPGPVPTCSDGVACTTDVCDPVSDTCKGVPDNANCPCGETCDPLGGCGNFCQIATCQGKVYACGDCLDNDGDCKIDSADDQCLGPCDNTEDSFYGGIAGQNNSPCKSDCYFDQDTGSGNDNCYWSHKCDPLEVPPDYAPEPSGCAYNPNATIPGYGGSCAEAFASQSATCLGYCGPLTPNGCDCFGCCTLPGLGHTVWLGSENPPGTGSCNIATMNDPTMCKPCTQVPACINDCEHCEICVGKPDLPLDCIEQTCPAGVQKCGQPGQATCPFAYSCITGCCIHNPE